MAHDLWLGTYGGCLDPCWAVCGTCPSIPTTVRPQLALQLQLHGQTEAGTELAGTPPTNLMCCPRNSKRRASETLWGLEMGRLTGQDGTDYGRTDYDLEMSWDYFWCRNSNHSFIFWIPPWTSLVVYMLNIWSNHLLIIKITTSWDREKHNYLTFNKAFNDIFIVEHFSRAEAANIITRTRCVYVW